MAKNRRRRQRHKQEHADTEDSSCSMKTTGHSRPSPLKRGNGFFPTQVDVIPTVMEDHSVRSELRYDAVILHSDKDGETALDVKTWLEDDLLEQAGDSGHSLIIELMGYINPDYVTSLEKAPKFTKTIIILCTKHIDGDEKFKKAIKALWVWQTEKDFQIIPLLIGFREGETPECITVKGAHIVHFKKESKYLKYLMASYLSPSSERRLQQDERSKQRERKAGKESHQQGHDVTPSLHPSGRTNGDFSPVNLQQMNPDNPEETLPPVSADCDSGVASAFTTASDSTSGLASFPSHDDGPCPDQCSSLSGPIALPHDPRVLPSPDVSARKPGNPPGASRSGVLSEGTNVSKVEYGDGGEARYVNENTNTKTESNGGEEQTSTNDTKHDGKRACSGQTQGSHTEDGNIQRKHASNGQITTQPASSGNQLCDSFGCSASGVTDSLQSISNSANDRPTLNTCTETQTTDLVPDSDSCFDADQAEVKRTPLKRRDCEPSDKGTDVQTDSQPVIDCTLTSGTTSTDQSENFEISNAGSQTQPKTVRTPPSTEADPQKHSREAFANEGYLTPISCCHDRNPCRYCHDSFLGSKKQKFTTVRPPNHSYINRARPHHTATLPSQLRLPAVRICNPVPKSQDYTVDSYEEYDTTESVTDTSTAELQPGSINIYHANSVVLHGTKCQTHDTDGLKQTADEMCSATSTTYQTWPCKTREMDYQYSVSEAAAAAVKADNATQGKTASCRPQLPPRCGHRLAARPCCSVRGHHSSKKKKSRLAVLSCLRVLLHCGKKKKRKEDGEMQIQELQISEDGENLYERMDYLTCSFGLNE